MFYDNFVYLCERRNEKPYALVMSLGAKSNSIVSQWKNGSKPREPLLSKIAEHFGVTVRELLYENLREKQTNPPAEARELSNSERELIELVKSLSEDEVKEISKFIDYIISKRSTED